uniref:Transmembrane protein 268 n=1 Tax=Esox lucius TaxID=8010 RepID=A0A3P8XJU0_ESOLU
MDQVEDKTSVFSDESDVEVDLRRSSKGQIENRRTSRWKNGQCVLAVPTSSMLNPSFDLSVCRALLEREGFQIPVAEFEDPLEIALDVPSVRRYLLFNSSLFHFIMAPINMNIDVRLIQVNERLSRHKLLVGVADWVQNCTGTLQLFIVYWDIAHCVKALTETLEERSFAGDAAQKRLKKRMSHLILVAEAMTFEPVVLGSSVNEGSDEERPLLVNNEETAGSTTTSQREDTKLTTNYNLVPDQILPVETKALQLLLTYGAVYVKLLMSEKLPNCTQHLRLRRNHCTAASLCLCQYVGTKVLQS